MLGKSLEDFVNLLFRKKNLKLGFEKRSIPYCRSLGWSFLIATLVVAEAMVAVVLGALLVVLVVVFPSAMVADLLFDFRPPSSLRSSPCLLLWTVCKSRSTSNLLSSGVRIRLQRRVMVLINFAACSLMFVGVKDLACGFINHVSNKVALVM